MKAYDKKATRTLWKPSELQRSYITEEQEMLARVRNRQEGSLVLSEPVRPRKNRRTVLTKQM